MEQTDPNKKVSKKAADKRLEGFTPEDKTDGEGNFVGKKGEGIQLRDPVAPTETRNAAAPEFSSGDAERIEDNNVEEMHKEYPATNIGPVVVKPYAPVKGLDEAYEASKKEHLKTFNDNRKMGEA